MKKKEMEQIHAAGKEFKHKFELFVIFGFLSLTIILGVFLNLGTSIIYDEYIKNATWSIKAALVVFTGTLTLALIYIFLMVFIPMWKSLRKFEKEIKKL